MPDRESRFNIVLGVSREGMDPKQMEADVRALREEIQRLKDATKGLGEAQADNHRKASAAPAPGPAQAAPAAAGWPGGQRPGWAAPSSPPAHGGGAGGGMLSQAAGATYAIGMGAQYTGVGAMSFMANAGNMLNGALMLAEGFAKVGSSVPILAMIGITSAVVGVGMVMEATARSTEKLVTTLQDLVFMSGRAFGTEQGSLNSLSSFLGGEGAGAMLKSLSTGEATAGPQAVLQERFAASLAARQRTPTIIPGMTDHFASIGVNRFKPGTNPYQPESLPDDEVLKSVLGRLMGGDGTFRARGIGLVGGDLGGNEHLQNLLEEAQAGKARGESLDQTFARMKAQGMVGPQLNENDAVYTRNLRNARNEFGLRTAGISAGLGRIGEGTITGAYTVANAALGLFGGGPHAQLDSSSEQQAQAEKDKKERDRNPPPGGGAPPPGSSGYPGQLPPDRGITGSAQWRTMTADFRDLNPQLLTFQQLFQPLGPLIDLTANISTQANMPLTGMTVAFKNLTVALGNVQWTTWGQAIMSWGTQASGAFNGVMTAIVNLTKTPLPSLVLPPIIVPTLSQLTLPTLPQLTLPVPILPNVDVPAWWANLQKSWGLNVLTQALFTPKPVIPDVDQKAYSNAFVAEWKRQAPNQTVETPVPNIPAAPVKTWSTSYLTDWDTALPGIIVETPAPIIPVSDIRGWSKDYGSSWDASMPGMNQNTPQPTIPKADIPGFSKDYGTDWDVALPGMQQDTPQPGIPKADVPGFTTDFKTDWNGQTPKMQQTTPTPILPQTNIGTWQQSFNGFWSTITTGWKINIPTPYLPMPDLTGWQSAFNSIWNSLFGGGAGNVAPNTATGTLSPSSATAAPVSVVVNVSAMDFTDPAHVQQMAQVVGNQVVTNMRVMTGSGRVV